MKNVFKKGILGRIPRRTSILLNERGFVGKPEISVVILSVLTVALFILVPPMATVAAKVVYVLMAIAAFVVSTLISDDSLLIVLIAAAMSIAVGYSGRFLTIGSLLHAVLSWGAFFVVIAIDYSVRRAAKRGI